MEVELRKKYDITNKMKPIWSNTSVINDRGKQIKDQKIQKDQQQKN